MTTPPPPPTDTTTLTDDRPPRPRPAPVPDHDSAPYWNALHEGRLLVQKCEDCDHFQLYPRDRCLACRGPVTFVEASGRGTVYSFTVIRQNYSRPFRDWIPYVVALVDLEEGPRLMTNLVDCDPETVEVGMAVRARFEPVSDEAGIALFAPDNHKGQGFPLQPVNWVCVGSPGHLNAVRDEIMRSTVDTSHLSPPIVVSSRCLHSLLIIPGATIQYSTCRRRRAALRHAAPVVFEGIVGPLVLFYATLLVFGFRGALISALCWSYIAVVRRIRRGERITALLMLGTLLLTLRTTVAFVTGSAFVYFIQPMAGAVCVAVVLLLISAALRRPFTQRFAHDFCPLDPALLARPRVQKFFVQISVVWAAVLLLNAGLVLWMLLSSSLKMFILERTAATWSLTAAAIAISIFGFTAAMRSDDVTVHWGTAPPVPASALVR